MNADFSEAEIDIANSARAMDWRSLQQPMVELEDRALELQLRNTIRRNAWRMKARLPASPPREVATIWRQHLQLLWALGAYRRRHPRVTPINQTAA